MRPRLTCGSEHKILLLGRIAVQMRDLWNAIDSAARFIAAIPVSLVPRHYWPQLDTVIPVSRAAFVSAIASTLLAAAMAIPAYLEYTEANAALAVDAMLRASGWRATPAGEAAPSDEGAVAMWFSGYLSPVAFFFFTPVGVLSLYLAATGWFRAVSSYVDDARGDPVLTAVDAVVRRAWLRLQTRRARRDRERLEGPEVPDRLLPGRAAGFPDADYVVVSSRVKPGWDPGAFVITSEKWFRLGTPIERHLPVGLRTFYPLTEITDHEVLRRGVPYQLPPVSGTISRSG